MTCPWQGAFYGEVFGKVGGGTIMMKSMRHGKGRLGFNFARNTLWGE
ncbi:MAG: hypothetical protein ACJAXZ_003478 [Akkermansiaceae bacterium]|jgi:hypothetical protein